MRRLLVDHARARRQQKRDGGIRVPLDADVAAVPDRTIDMLDLDDGEAGLDDRARVPASGAWRAAG
jgi:hypothetical protein